MQLIRQLLKGVQKRIRGLRGPPRPLTREDHIRNLRRVIRDGDHRLAMDYVFFDRSFLELGFKQERRKAWLKKLEGKTHRLRFEVLSDDKPSATLKFPYAT